MRRMLGHAAASQSYSPSESRADIHTSGLAEAGAGPHRPGCLGTPRSWNGPKPPFRWRLGCHGASDAGDLADGDHLLDVQPEDLPDHARFRFNDLVPRLARLALPALVNLPSSESSSRARMSSRPPAIDDKLLDQLPRPLAFGHCHGRQRGNAEAAISPAGDVVTEMAQGTSEISSPPMYRRRVIAPDDVFVRGLLYDLRAAPHYPSRGQPPSKGPCSQDEVRCRHVCDQACREAGSDHNPHVVQGQDLVDVGEPGREL